MELIRREKLDKLGNPCVVIEGYVQKISQSLHLGKITPEDLLSDLKQIRTSLETINTTLQEIKKE